MFDLNNLFTTPAFSQHQSEKEALLLTLFNELTTHHKAACPAYARMINLAFPQHAQAQGLEDIPYLPISLFKYRTLRSVAAAEVRVTVSSSGTTGSLKSQIVLDTETARLASKALAATLGTLVGRKRLPMLIIDTKSSLHTQSGMGARAAAILGLMPFGHDHSFVLRDDLTLDETALTAFLDKHGEGPFLIYGFTFLVWQALAPFCETHKVDLSNATLLHSGGWKKLTDQAVDNAAFKNRLRKASGLDKIINFYGMAEMPGVIFAENENGLLYAPPFADVMIRDPLTFAPLPHGQVGLIEVMNLVPRSFPGHALLTEDRGVIESVDSGANGWQGKGLRVLGRAPKAALRGCSDVMAMPPVM